MILKPILFLIGVQELSQGVRDFDKEEKTHLFHIATCKLLAPYGYYKFKMIDEDGWPHWEELKPVENLSDKEQTLLMKKSIIILFSPLEFTQINHFKKSKDLISSIGLICDGEPSIDYGVDEIIWTIPIFSLSSLLNVQSSISEKGDPPKAQKSIYFLLKNPPNMDDLYYFFCFDPGFKTFRVTNYSQYCEDAVRKSESEFGISIDSFVLNKPTLDDVFISYTGHNLRDDTTGKFNKRKEFNQSRRRAL